MGKTGDFDFGAASVAETYEDSLVPALFEPWANQLLDGYPAWKDQRVLDLGTGTGIVARLLAGRVGSQDRVLATDVNAEMLSQARRHCLALGAAVEFVESPASPLNIPSGSVDVVVCQQAFQFFPDRQAAAGEMYRVLSNGGRAIVSTWRPVSECDFFGAICEALNAVGEKGIADMMRVPFDFLPESELSAHFTSVGFQEVDVVRQERPLVLSGGLPHALRVAYATPIGPKLRALPEGKQSRFRESMGTVVGNLSKDGAKMGRMTANVLSAGRPS